MTSTDEAVLEFIGLYGTWHEDIAERFPGFDVMRLVRAHLIAVVLVEGAASAARAHSSPISHVRYVLTDRGAEAAGIAAD